MSRDRFQLFRLEFPRAQSRGSVHCRGLPSLSFCISRYGLLVLFIFDNIVSVVFSWTVNNTYKLRVTDRFHSGCNHNFSYVLWRRSFPREYISKENDNCLLIIQHLNMSGKPRKVMVPPIVSLPLSAILQSYWYLEPHFQTPATACYSSNMAIWTSGLSYRRENQGTQPPIFHLSYLEGFQGWKLTVRVLMSSWTWSLTMQWRCMWRRTIEDSWDGFC
jgi:hypothetical protein